MVEYLENFKKDNVDNYKHMYKSDIYYNDITFDTYIYIYIYIMEIAYVILICGIILSTAIVFIACKLYAYYCGIDNDEYNSLINI